MVSTKLLYDEALWSYAISPLFYDNFYNDNTNFIVVSMASSQPKRLSNRRNNCLGERIIRWHTTVTSKQNVHIKFKSLTANSNCSQQITNPPQQITNRSHQIQIQYNSLTANTNTVGVKRRLRTADQGKKQTEGKMKTAD